MSSMESHLDWCLPYVYSQLSLVKGHVNATLQLWAHLELAWTPAKPAMQWLISRGGPLMATKRNKNRKEKRTGSTPQCKNLSHKLKSETLRAGWLQGKMAITQAALSSPAKPYHLWEPYHWGARPTQESCPLLNGNTAAPEWSSFREDWSWSLDEGVSLAAKIKTIWSHKPEQGSIRPPVSFQWWPLPGGIGKEQYSIYSEYIFRFWWL